MAASTRPTTAPAVASTVRPYRRSGGTGETAAAGRVMLSPVPEAGPDRPSTGRRRWRAGWMLALGLIVLLGAALVLSAAASPTTGSAAAQPTPVPPQPLSTSTVAHPCEQPDPPLVCAPTPTPTDAPSAPPTTTTPCSGEDCIPHPTTPPPGGGAGPGQIDDGTGEPECGLTNIGGCIARAINGVFRGLVNAALSPILNLLGHTALSTPTLDSLPGIGELWTNSWELVVAAYGLIVVVGGIVVMSHESIQTRYSIKEIGPRIPVAFLASALSLFFADKFIRIANAVTLGLLGGDLAPSLGDTLQDAVAGLSSGGLFIILVGLVLVVIGLGLLIVYVVRIVLTLILIISGPLFLMCHALPHTDPLARWWWRAITAVLGIQVFQALVLITAVRTFLSGGVHLFGSTLSALGTLVAAIALFWILFKIPFWLLSAVKVSSGRSFLGGLARAYVAAKTFGMVAGRSGAFHSASTASGGTTNSDTGPTQWRHTARNAARASDPYARSRATADGQYLLPLTGVRRHPAAATRQPAPVPNPRATPVRQLALPLGNDWAENKPVLGRDGQYRLPLDVERVKRTPPPAATATPRAGRPRGRQLEFPFDPYKGNRATRSGQYPLPLEGVQRQQGTPPPPSTPPTPAKRTPATDMPVDPYKGNRATHSGQYSLPLDGVHRVPSATPTPAPARPTPRKAQQLRLPLDLPKPPRRTPPPPPPSTPRGGQS